MWRAGTGCVDPIMLRIFACMYVCIACALDSVMLRIFVRMCVCIYVCM